MTIDITKNMGGHHGGVMRGLSSAHGGRPIAPTIHDHIKNEPIPPVEFRILELDTAASGMATLLVCAPRVSSIQLSAQVYMSSYRDEGYSLLGRLKTFATEGTLIHDYPSYIPTFDTVTGIRYSGIEGDAPHVPISRYDLFRAFPQRVLVIDDEVMGFGGAAPIGKTDFLCTDIVRGLFHTSQQTHKKGSRVYSLLTNGTLFTTAESGQFYFKVVPVTHAHTLMDPSQYPAIPFLIQHRHLHALPPTNIHAFRVGGYVSLAWTPCIKGPGGAGEASVDVLTDQSPVMYPGDFIYSLNTEKPQITSRCEATVFCDTAFDFTVAHRIIGHTSSPIHIHITEKEGYHD